nr:MAG: replication associated protein [Cressdnaviricota sp.]
MKRRRWCFTDWQLLNNYDLKEKEVRYCIYQLEEAPSTKRWHYQGYIELYAPRDKEWLKKRLGIVTSYILCDGTQKHNIEYCTKQFITKGEFKGYETKLAGPWTFGKPGEQGKRNDLIKLRDEIQKGATDFAMIQDDELLPTFAKFFKFADRIRNAYQKEMSKQFRIIEVNIIYGPAGTGKTRYVYDKHGYNNVYSLQSDCQKAIWFDGYEGEKVLLIDDFYGWIKYSTLLRLLDGYPFRCNIKGSYAYGLWDKIYITSNKSPDLWYKQGMTDALTRRINFLEIKLEGTEVGGNIGPPLKIDIKKNNILINYFLNLNFKKYYKCTRENLSIEELTRKKVMEEKLQLIKEKLEELTKSQKELLIEKLEIKNKSNILNTKQDQLL